MWIRYVLVPGLTDGYDNVEKLADFVRRAEDGRARGDPALPPDGPRQVAQAAASTYPLENVEPPDAELTERVRGQFRSRGLTVY